MLPWIIIIGGYSFSIVLIILAVYSLIQTNKRIKAPLTEEDMKFALACRLFDGNEDEIRAHELEVKQQLYFIEMNSVIRNEAFTYSLYPGKDYFKFMDVVDFNDFVRQLALNNIRYYAYKVSYRTMEYEREHGGYYSADYYIRVSEDDLDEAYRIFDELDPFGDKYRYFIENGEEICTAF